MMRIALVIISAVAMQTAAPEPSRRLYLATVAAADAALRLHETDRARHWLAEAPEALRGWEWRYLSAQADHSTATFDLGHGAISDLAVSPDGQVLAVAGADHSVRLVAAATGAVVRTLAGHTAAVWSPKFSADGRRLATVSSDGTARLWDVASGESRHVLTSVGRGVGALAWSPDHSRVAVSSWDSSRERGVWGTVSVWDTSSGGRVHQFDHGDKPIGSIAYTPDGQSIVLATWDFDVARYTTDNWRQVFQHRPPESEDYKAAFALAIAPDGRLAATSHADQRVRLWDVASGALVRTLHTPTEGQLKAIRGLTFLPDGATLVTAGDDLTVRLWDVATGRERSVHHGHDRAVLSVVASADGRALYSAGADGTVRVWEVDRLAPERSVWRLPNEPYAIAFNPDQTQAVVSTWEGWVRIFAVRSGRELHAWRGHQQSAVGAAWSADGQWIATTGNDGRVAIWNAATRALAAEVAPRTGQILSVQFSPDSALVAAGGGPGAVHLWRVPTGEPVATLTGGGDGAVGYLAFSPEGRALAAGSHDGVVRVWDMASHALRHRVELGVRAGTDVAWHPSGERLAAATGRTVSVLDPRDGRILARLPAPVATVSSLAYSPDGRRLSLALGNNTFELWDAETGDVLLRFPQVASAWFTTWTRRGDLVLIPLDKTVRLLTAGS